MKKEFFHWEEEASILLKKVPFFVRKFAKNKVEEAVRSEGRIKVTADDVKKTRANFLKEIDRQKQEVSSKDTESGSGVNSQPKLYEIEFCKGKTLGCPFGIVEPQELANILEDLLNKGKVTEHLIEKIEGLILPHHRLKIAISGCSNGCPQPQIKDFGMIAQAVPKREDGQCSSCGLCIEACQEGAISLEEGGPEFNRKLCLNCGLCAKACPQGAITIEKIGYRLLLGGRLGRHPRFGQEIIPLASEEEVVKVVQQCLESFKSLAFPQENFSSFVERLKLAR